MPERSDDLQPRDAPRLYISRSTTGGGAQFLLATSRDGLHHGADNDQQPTRFLVGTTVRAVKRKRIRQKSGRQKSAALPVVLCPRSSQTLAVNDNNGIFRRFHVERCARFIRQKRTSARYRRKRERNVRLFYRRVCRLFSRPTTARGENSPPPCRFLALTVFVHHTPRTPLMTLSTMRPTHL